MQSGELKKKEKLRHVKKLKIKNTFINNYTCLLFVLSYVDAQLPNPLFCYYQFEFHPKYTSLIKNMKPSKYS